MLWIRRCVPAFVLVPALVVIFLSCQSSPDVRPSSGTSKASAAPKESFDARIAEHHDKLFEEGREIFRKDTFGSEHFWGGQLKLHQAISGAKLGGVGAGVSPRLALKVGLKVDVAALPDPVVAAIKGGKANLDSPETTLALLQADAVIGVKGVFDDGKRMTSIGITCAFCHSTVDDSLATGIGRRLDGWPNRDLNVGEIVALAPNLKPFEEALQVDDATLRQVLRSWGPGKYDAELNQDGKAKGSYGRSGATLLPAIFGLAGQNLHTYTGWGSTPYWNAYVANTQMHGRGTFVDRRLNDPERFPVAARTKAYDKRDSEDLITSKLAALHFY